MQRSMRGFLHRRERKKTNVVRLAHFFERPANAHVTRQSLAAIGRPFKGGNGGDHWTAPGDCMTPLCVTVLIAKADLRSEEHTSELQSLMRNSYAVFCLKKKKKR